MEDGKLVPGPALSAGVGPRGSEKSQTLFLGFQALMARGPPPDGLLPADLRLEKVGWSGVNYNLTLPTPGKPTVLIKFT